MTQLIRANKAGQQVKDILASITKLDAAHRASILAILDTTSASLDPMKIADIAAIKDATTRLSVETALTLARTSITSIRVAIGG